MRIVFYHPDRKMTREAPVGFSWTMLFFGVFVPLFRSDWKWLLITALAGAASSGLSWLVFPFFYNKMYVKDLVNSGFKVRKVYEGTLEEAEAKLEMELPTLDEDDFRWRTPGGAGRRRRTEGTAWGTGASSSALSSLADRTDADFR